MQKPLSSTQITIDSINLLPLSSPLKCKSVIYSQQSCDNINFFLSRLNSAMEEIDLDSQSQTNSTSIEQPLKDEKIVPSSVSSSNCNSSSLYEGSYYYDEQSLLDKISLLELEQN